MTCALRWTMTALAIVTVSACVGETSREPTVSGDGSAAVQPSADGALSSCTATGELASCDPVTADGCGKGDCYLVAGQGPSCVCPAGTAAEGEACNTTTECEPSLVCAGTSPPGTCRKTCLVGDTSCPAGTFCRKITAFPTYGYCDPDGTGVLP
jgi:hypothetical protein